ncbi:type II secretion system protein N [Coralloluteibacterium stylophorae]|uniref:Type II secretion system protein C n=1 Tax=Coralloluteibacterium stylophorae TaxID=1776034 RepID=A0AAP2CG95_9GAMM|nr:type II secretion system protein N [Coralloluteibacterium stylophorae]MBS7458920.1 type II secretion system protein C [Coralloluteibacterium stylophorae]
MPKHAASGLIAGAQDLLRDRARLRALRPGARAWWPALEAMVVVLLAVQAARLVWMLATPLVAGAGVPAPATAVPVLARSDLFFREGGTAATPVADVGGWTLFGTRSDGRGGGSAILADGSGRQASVRAGESLARGMVLAEIHPDHVLVDTGGSHRRLDLSAAAAVLPRPVAARAPSATGGAAPRVDAERLVAEAGLRVREQDGRVTGYTLIPRAGGRTLRAAGLQSGDILLAVNGQDLDAERLAELPRELAGRSSATLTIERGGERQTITLNTETP